MPRPPRRPPHWLRDARFTVPLLVIGLLGTGPASHQQPEWKTPGHLAYLLVVVAAGSFLLRSVQPALALVLNTAAVATYLAVGYAYGPIVLTVPVMALAIAATWPRRKAAYGVGAAAVVLAAATVYRVGHVAHGDGWAELLTGWLVWGTVIAALFAIGSTIRVRRESAAGVRAEQAKRAASEEQLRMAQELHDVVGHGLAVIALQAGVALHVLDREPDVADGRGFTDRRVRESLEAIRTLSRESLDGLRAEVAALRADDPPARRPSPGLADLDVLVARIRAGGVDVRLDVARSEVPDDVAAAAYRIVQESLTNVLRHAQAGRATVRVATDGPALRVEVTDEGRGGPVTGGGSGIRGMRERAQSLGGTLEAGAGTSGGFAVRALLPVRPASEPAGPAHPSRAAERSEPVT